MKLAPPADDRCYLAVLDPSWGRWRVYFALSGPAGGNEFVELEVVRPSAADGKGWAFETLGTGGAEGARGWRRLEGGKERCSGLC